MRQQSKQRPNQQSGHMQGTVPVSRAANLFLMSALGFFGICVCILIAVIGTREFERIQRIAEQEKVDLLGGAVEAYVDNRLDILHDQAGFSSIKQAVMQPEARKADAVDFMSMLSILGTKPQMVLLDFEGAEIHRTQENPDVDFTGYRWVSRIIDGTQSQYAGILQLPGGPHWCIAVPVLYHGQPEGILTAVIPLQNMKKSAHLPDMTSGEELKILQKGTVFATFGTDDAAGITQKTVLDRFNLTLQHTDQAAQISAARNRLLFTVTGMLLLMSLSIALAAVVLARKWLVKPLQQLRDATHSISNKTGTVRFGEQESRIQEVALLSKDLKAMAKQINDRESNLMASEERFRTLYESSRDAIMMLDDTGFSDCNTQALATFGVESKEAFCRLHPADISPAEQDDGRDSMTVANEKIESAMRVGGNRFEWLYKHHNTGEVFPAEVLLTRMELGGKQVLHASVRDISERKQAVADIVRIQTAINATSEGIICIDMVSRIFYVNISFGFMCNHTQEELQGLPIESLFVDSNAVKEAIEATTEGNSGKGENRLLVKGGEEVPVSLNVAEILNESVNSEGFVLIVSDLTDQKKAEKERAILEMDLLHAQKLEAVGNLAAGVAHEINTPIQFVGDNLWFLQDSCGDLLTLSNKYRELIDHCKTKTCGVIDDMSAEEKAITDTDLDYLNEEIPSAIQQSLEGTDRVARLVRAMKEFSHPGITGMTFSNINKAIQTTIVIARNEWKYVADVNTELDDALPLVPCFVNEFNQVILNMIVNACDAIAEVLGEGSSEKGTITISTSLKNDFAEIRVRDTGAGMPDNVKKHIFDPFFTTKEIGKGSGQGLKIAYKVIVDKHKGELEVESDVGKGTTFLIRLPLKAAEVGSQEV